MTLAHAGRRRLRPPRTALAMPGGSRPSFARCSALVALVSQSLPRLPQTPCSTRQPTLGGACRQRPTATAAPRRADRAAPARVPRRLVHTEMKKKKRRSKHRPDWRPAFNTGRNRRVAQNRRRLREAALAAEEEEHAPERAPAHAPEHESEHEHLDWVDGLLDVSM